MRIGLVYPSRSHRTTYSTHFATLQELFDTNTYVPSFFLPSLSLLTIAGSTPADVELTLIDERVRPIDFEEPFDMVGISIMTEQARRGYEVARRFKERGIFTVMGGIHTSVLPEEASQHCDAVVIGEGERSWPQLLADFARGQVKERYTNEGPIDLTASPIPRYDLVDPQSYHLMPTQATRGCPLDCSFCTVTKVYGKKYRNKTIAQSVAEIEAIQQVSRSRRIVFNDDNMFVNRKISYERLEAIAPLRIRYFAESDVSIAVDEKLLQLMSKSGCVEVFVGFESLEPDNLATLQNSQWKRKRLEQYSEACRRIQSHGIQVIGAFILGFDHDTPDTIRRLIDFTLENHITGQYHLLTPYPGTRSREQLIAEERLPPDHNDWDYYNCFDMIFTPGKMTRAEIEQGVLEIYRTVYTPEAHSARSRHMIELIKERKRHPPAS